MSRSARASAPSVDPILVEILGPEAESLPPALAARVAEALGHVQAPAANVRVPAFFDALDRPRIAFSSCGGTWRDTSLPHDIKFAFANVDQALAGLEGVAEVLAAGEWARTADDVERQLGDNLTERLFHALLVLSSYSRATLEESRAFLAGENA